MPADSIDFSIFFAEPFDPCAALALIRPTYMNMKYATAGATQKIRFRDREVWFHKVDMAAWDQLVLDLERQCTEKQGLPRRRFAIRGGYPVRH